MTQNLYPPMALLKKTAQQYPKAWELMANFHAENGMNGLPTWPDWCYAPMSAAVAIASGGRNFLLLPVNQQQDIINSAQKIFALATWRLSKEVYQLDPDFAQLLFEQTNDLDIPSEIFLQLPYPCFYIEVPDLFFGAKPIHGFFVNLEYDVNNGDRELRLFIESIKEQPLVLEEWNERLWVGLLEKATVFHDGRMVFEFKNGTWIEVEL